MPQLKKSDLERLAWAWIEDVQPDEIQRIHLETAYKIGLKYCKNCKRNCSHNPCCLTGLGEEKYLKSVPAEIGSLESSLTELRDPTQYVGLKNLGATCYVNSLIQVWFHNEDMRRIIYKWEIADDPEESEGLHHSQHLKHPYHPRTVVGQLQYIFAMMQFGNKRLLDPTSLAIALSLDTDTQQDAQEFSKLLLAHIENKLQSLSLKSRLQQLTQGTYIYVNRCSTCLTEYQTPTTFYELDLQLAPTLKEAIENYLSEEELGGANKYHCRQCNDKQTAKRFIRLDSLPDTLNFQLLRFVFHRESGQKKKLSSFIQFPEDLDMSEYLTCPPGSHLYSLVAVLSHKGPSAHSGHYIVNICNSSNEWYQFSDDKVEKMQNKRIEDGLSDNGKVSKRSKVPKGFLSSNTAYMLVYKKNPLNKSKKIVDNGKRKETSDSDSSDTVLSPVKKVKVKHKLSKRAKQEDAPKIEALEDNSQQETPIIPEKSEIEEDNLSVEADKNGAEIPEILMKKNYDKDYEKLNGDAHRAMGCGERDFYEAMEFEKWGLSETLRELIQQENVAHELSLLALQEEKQKRIEEQNEKRLNVIDFFKRIADFSGDLTKFLWIPTSWINRWLNDHSGSNEGVGEIDAGDLVCSHGNMDVGKVHRAKCVPMDAAEMLIEKFGVRKRLDDENLCEICVRRRFKVVKFKVGLERDHKEVLEIIKGAKDVNEDCFIVGAESFKYWRKLAMERLDGETRAEHEAEGDNQKLNFENHREEVEDEMEGLLCFNDDLLCEHQGLRTPDGTRKIIPGAAWRILKKYFPDSVEYAIGSENCVICEERAENAQKAKADDKIKGKHQKDELGELYSGKNRNEVAKCKNKDRVYYVLEKGFVDAWKGFIRTGRNAPTGINNGQLLCELHKGFFYIPITTSELYTIVTEEEWNKLNEFYQSDNVIKIKNIGGEEPELQTEPEQCNECIQARLAQERLDSLNYDKATIYIKHIDDAEENESAVKCVRSSRTRRKAKGSHELKVSSQTTLKELKVMTMAICGAGPFDQHLMLDDRELTESDQNLAALGIYPGALLKLKVDTPPDNEVDLESDSTSREAASPEKGFKGTELVPS